MVFSKWRARRQSVKELRREEAAVHEEYLRMRELDRRTHSQGQGDGMNPPSYGIVVAGSGEDIVGIGTKTSPTSGANVSRGR